ncbi:MAG: hypothetical protein E6Q97_00980 [Desulfurellales bacterium]|nr:MAG: hypothetical protein E6Q97_00980 [Desulfurellales bacterium]
MFGQPEDESDVRVDDIHMVQSHVFSAIEDLTRAIEDEHCDKVTRNVVATALHDLAPALRALSDRIIEKRVGEVVKRHSKSS